MKPKRYSPWIPKEAYHDSINWMVALAEGREQEDEEVSYFWARRNNDY